MYAQRNNSGSFARLSLVTFANGDSDVKVVTLAWLDDASARRIPLAAVRLAVDSPPQSLSHTQTHVKCPSFFSVFVQSACYQASEDQGKPSDCRSAEGCVRLILSVETATQLGADTLCYALRTDVCPLNNLLIFEWREALGQFLLAIFDRNF